MGSIVPRKRRDGSIGYTAQIRITKSGKTIHNETETFDREQAAKAWLKKRETELAKPGAIEAANQDDPLLKDLIDRYVRESRKAIGRTKIQCLNTLKADEIGEMRASKVDSATITALAQRLGKDKLPQTVGNYISHLASIFTIARPAWNVPLEKQAMDDARVVMHRLGAVSRSRKRDRRPTLEELDQLMEHFGKLRANRGDTIPMRAISAMTIFSLRRDDEICRIVWKDLDVEGSRVMVRDLKHPGEKIGNDQWCDLTPEALRIVLAQPRNTADGRIFPYNAKSVSSAFTRAVAFLGIDDLHLNDLRHEGASRLSELGWSVQRVAAVSGHRSWNTLKRYTQFRQVGDKFANWKWLDVIAPPVAVATETESTVAA
ncbi:tyrosine-type recombinase/integrase [Paraburkholderia terrae]|uniref:tyrosine-type recombinase/integrase n=1 Tax=Paraburkholderia terrae TaxID=311230 RepID=UPI001EE2E5CA|nr:tyrosine-type recombinase/integrase [Paraburkholderia terrae]GJH00197.1 site-specific integrase [Paraburkholderia terrae]